MVQKRVMQNHLKKQNRSHGRRLDGGVKTPKESMCGQKEVNEQK